MLIICFASFNTPEVNSNAKGNIIRFAAPNFRHGGNSVESPGLKLLADMRNRSPDFFPTSARQSFVASRADGELEVFKFGTN